MVRLRPGDSVDAFLAHALRGDTRRAVDLTLELLGEGCSEEAVITDLLAPAQRTVGQLWQANQLTVADEHLATGAAESALHALAGSARAPGGPIRVVLACAEGDRHAIAAHMFAERLRSNGVIVSDLGATAPADHIARFLEHHRPDALAISCSLPIYYAGLARLASAAHGVGVPVLAGGRSLDASAERALRLGADGWAGSVPDAVALLDRWREHGPPRAAGAAPLPAAAVELDRRAGELAAAAFADLPNRYPPMAAFDRSQMDRTREDLAVLVQFVAAARLVDDPVVLTEYLEWLTDLLAARHVPEAAVVAGLQALHPLLADVDPGAARLAEVGLDHLAQRAAGQARIC